jgi:hypothetical protein
LRADLILDDPSPRAPRPNADAEAGEIIVEYDQLRFTLRNLEFGE